MKSKFESLRIWLTRRDFLKIGLSFSAILTSWGILKFLSFRDPRTPTTRITLDIPEAYSIGSVTPVPEVRAWILRDNIGLYALSSVCTHLGCLVNYDGTQFECPCHGSKFNLMGNVLNGPALRQLDYVELTTSEDNKIILDTTKHVSSSDRLEIVY